MLDICNAGGDGWVSYSRAKQHYSLPKRYQSRLYSYRAIVGQVDKLDGLGLIEHARRAPGDRGWQSALKATPQLLDICGRAMAGQAPTLAKPAEVILLRDDVGHLIEYRETRAIARMRGRVEAFNEAIASAGLDPAISAPLARIFNLDMKRGGRFYAMGASWQNLKAEARREVTIGGEPVAEIDYVTLHPAILYAESGAAMPADCYAITGWPRKLVKVAMLILINAKNHVQARLAIATHDRMAEVAAPGSQEAFQKASQLIKDIKTMHRPIARAFHSDAGARLMLIDAALAEAVMNIMLAQGVVVLPVHDSFLVQAKDKGALQEAMMKAAHELSLWALQAEEKT